MLLQKITHEEKFHHTMNKLARSFGGVIDNAPSQGKVEGELVKDEEMLYAVVMNE